MVMLLAPMSLYLMGSGATTNFNHQYVSCCGSHLPIGMAAERRARPVAASVAPVSEPSLRLRKLLSAARRIDVGFVLRLG